MSNKRSDTSLAVGQVGTTDNALLIESADACDGNPPIFSPIWQGMGSHADPTPHIEMHPEFNRLMKNMPHLPGLCFSPLQMAFLSQAAKRKPARHIIDYRVSIPFLGHRFYLTVFFGREKRNDTRLSNEGQISLQRVGAAYTALAFLLAVPLAVAAISVLYVIKCLLGIDLVDGPSVMHELFFGDWTIQSSP